jgi:pilus assembly protein TadC
MTGLLGLALTLALGTLWGVVIADAVDRALCRRVVRSPLAVAADGSARLALQWPVGALAWRRVSEQRRQRQREAAVVDQLPDVVDLLRLTTDAGLPVPAAVAAIGERPGGPVGTAFRQAATLCARGSSTAEVLPVIARMCGPPARRMVDALSDHDRYGTALGPTLDRLAFEARLYRRHRAEEAARRLPVLLLFPLVMTVLPAFVLLAIVPLVIGSFASLPL